MSLVSVLVVVAVAIRLTQNELEPFTEKGYKLKSAEVYSLHSDQEEAQRELLDYAQQAGLDAKAFRKTFAFLIKKIEGGENPQEALELWEIYQRRYREEFGPTQEGIYSLIELERSVARISGPASPVRMEILALIIEFRENMERLDLVSAVHIDKRLVTLYRQHEREAEANALNAAIREQLEGAPTSDREAMKLLIRHWNQEEDELEAAGHLDEAEVLANRAGELKASLGP